MSFTNINTVAEAKEIFQRLSIDNQLAFLWFVYTKIGKSVTPAAPGAAGSEIAGKLFNRVKQLSHEEQLQVQRDIANRKSTEFSREYGSLSPETKLAFWYYLAQGMEAGTIIPMPENYQLPAEGTNLLGEVEAMDFNDQIDFLRDSVLEMGAPPAQGARV
jgi:hypothetical protein